jgi:1-acyl-sn-glycerol-3-phosphate acyltransferase
VTAVRSFIFNAVFYAWTAAMLLACTPVLLLDRKATVQCQTAWARFVLLLMRKIAGIDVEIRGRERVPAQPVVFAAKHQSAWDTLIWHVIIDDPAVVMKRELLMLPWYGWYSLKAGMIPVDRSGGAPALKRMIRAAERAIGREQSVVIFPQGTRTAPGVRIPYQPGATALYRALSVPVVPVALNSGLFWPRRSFLRRPGRIVLEFLQPIEPGLSRSVFENALAERIESATEVLEAEAEVTRSRA